MRAGTLYLKSHGSLAGADISETRLPQRSIYVSAVVPGEDKTLKVERIASKAQTRDYGATSAR
jgi:hypothetical protein